MTKFTHYRRSRLSPEMRTSPAELLLWNRFQEKDVLPGNELDSDTLKHGESAMD